MQKRNNHNSILLLTTLGVYIGLVLVGAPSGVFAYPAATTRSFNISEEIEFTENLDNDPDSAAEEDDVTSNAVGSVGGIGEFNFAFIAENDGQFTFSFDTSGFDIAGAFLQTPNAHFDHETAAVNTGFHHENTERSDTIRIKLGTHLARSDIDAPHRRA